jgi:hypothetical protein
METTVNTNEVSSTSTSQRWERPLDFPSGFWKRQLPTKHLEIAGRGDIASLEKLLTEHPEFLNKRGAHNRTLLWEAVRRGKLAMVKWLVECGAACDAMLKRALPTESIGGSVCATNE